MGAFRWFALLLFTLLICGSAHAERRVALVIGNSAYKSVPRLANPASDAALVGGMFNKAGFDWVDVETDLNAAQMRKALRDFGGRARDAEVAVIYYAGHGIELDGTNYLIPIDATLETDADVLDETVGLDRALFAVEPAKQLRLVILDACRDNPFAKSMKRTVATRAIGRGLAKVEPASPNTMIAFAAKAGSTASDGDSKNSPFATNVVERLPIPGLDLRKAFGFVRDDVLKSTGYRQEPYVYGSLGGDDVPLVPPKPETAARVDSQDAVRRDYELALQIGTRDVWNAFLAKYPDGFYASLAKGQIDRIAAEETRIAAVAKARAAEEERARLASDRADRTEQDNAAAAAKAAEDAQFAAEKAKQIEEAKLAAAEQRLKELDDKPDVAALSPQTSQPPPSAEEISKLVQLELRRVGCLAAPAEKGWNAAAQRSLALFNKYAGAHFEIKLASLDALDAIKLRQGRVCPLVCEHGFKPTGDECVRTTCQGAQVLNADGECVPKGKGETPSRRPDRPLASKPETANSRPTEQRSPGSGQCTSISQRCAVEIGGRCNPATGHWEYGRNGAGGNTQAFNACIGRMLAGRRQ